MKNTMKPFEEQGNNKTIFMEIIMILISFTYIR